MSSYAEIHKIYKLSGSTFPSGIRISRCGNFFVLIANSHNVYRDEILGEKMLYMGHGQKGDQIMWRDNKKLNDAPQKTLCVVYTKRDGKLFFKGLYYKDGQTLQKDYDNRKVFLFPLTKVDNQLLRRALNQ